MVVTAPGGADPAGAFGGAGLRGAGGVEDAMGGEIRANVFDGSSTMAAGTWTSLPQLNISAP